MAEVPSRIKVGACHYRVIRDSTAIADTRYNSNAPGAVGEARPKSMEIILDPTRPADAQGEDLLHEVEHCVHWQVGIGTEEKIQVHEYMRRTTPTLLAVLKDNPELVKFLVEDAPTT